ncbi:Pr6Pr family membrane protein [Dyella acidiphila]|uniref:Pr6Pr family membrane protein n=1 Tax=Dyella acidiphila TaxID=2775866 RepID=A0ABR9G8B7_9GAMM|nr:Pr6Pr family membrane protein [Dyella acidiphila]MBE1160285.1 Pr6Pr family membrane protein [Dyella acidiphila]
MPITHTLNGKTRWLAVLIALAGWSGLLLQWYLLQRAAQTDGRGIGQLLVAYFGYFTILTNLLVCAAVSWPLAAPTSAPGRFFLRPAAIGWVTASIVFVGLAYHLLLRRIWQPQGLHWVANTLLHYVTPGLFVIYSLAMLRGIALRWTAPLWWSGYLVAYFVYALVRGALIGSYPYGFIDVAALGYAVTIRNGCFLLLAFLLLGYVLIGAWRLGSRRS